MPVRCPGIDSHAVGGQRCTDNIQKTGVRDTNVLVQAIVSVSDISQVGTIGVTTKSDRLPIADIVIGIGKLLSGHRCDGIEIRPITFCAG